MSDDQLLQMCASTDCRQNIVTVLNMHDVSGEDRDLLAGNIETLLKIEIAKGVQRWAEIHGIRLEPVGCLRPDGTFDHDVVPVDYLPQGLYGPLLAQNLFDSVERTLARQGTAGTLVSVHVYSTEVEYRVHCVMAKVKE